MLSRVANGLFNLGKSVERAQHVAQILEVNHKMNLERPAHDDADVWRAISDAFECEVEVPNEYNLYQHLVLSPAHPYSVRQCIGKARFEGRAMREHVSEEIWLHLNQVYLEFETLTFDRILGMGRSEFNHRVRVFSDALGGLSDDTMIRGEAWAFLKVGKLTERAAMSCRVLKIKEQSITPEHDGAPIDVHQWQALLRSLSGYEPYRRAYDAQIIPSRVLDFVLKRKDFPRSLTACLHELQSVLGLVSRGSMHPLELELLIARLLNDLQRMRPEDLLASGTFPAYLGNIQDACLRMEEETSVAFFSNLRPALARKESANSIGAMFEQ